MATNTDQRKQIADSIQILAHNDFIEESSLLKICDHLRSQYGMNTAESVSAAKEILEIIKTVKNIKSMY